MADSPTKFSSKVATISRYVDEEAETTDIKTQVNRIQMIIKDSKKES